MKTYIIQKTVQAKSLEDAIKLDKKTVVESCWIKDEEVVNRVGF